MYGEFCFFLDKKQRVSGCEGFSSFGSLLETQVQELKLGNITGLMRAYDSKINISEGEVVILLGEAVYDGILYSSAHQLYLDKVDVSLFVEKARGSFLIIKINSLTSEVSFFNDSLSLYPVYFFENERFVALSNMPIWMESVLLDLGVSVARDGHLAGYDLAIGTGAFGVTGWSEFHLIPFGTAISLTQKKLSINECRPLKRFFTDLPFEKLAKNAESELKENINAIAKSYYKNKVVDITGGMDSRLVLSIIFSLNFKDSFIYNTNGEYPVPDANCALSIMEKFGLTRVKFDCDYQQSVATQPIATFKKYIYQSQGARFIYDRAFETNCKQAGLIKVGGGLAGGFKSTYSLRLSDQHQGDPSLVQAVDAMFLPSAKYLAKDLVASIRKNLEKQFVVLHEQYGLSYKAAMDFFYVLSRNRYFIGVGEMPSSAIRPKVHALYSESLIKAAFKLTDSERKSGKLHYVLMKSLSPALFKLPFSDQSWDTEILSSEDKVSIDDIKPITAKSERHYREVKEKNIKLKSKPQETEADDAAVMVDTAWRERQRKLGRNWMWRNFDNIHSQAKMLFNKDDVDLSFVFQEQGIGFIIKNHHTEYKRASDLRAVINVLFLLLFVSRNESVSRVSDS